ncbi:unnamed protein product [Brassica rapa subsp. trilocularis]
MKHEFEMVCGAIYARVDSWWRHTCFSGREEVLCAEDFMGLKLLLSWAIGGTEAYSFTFIRISGFYRAEPFTPNAFA